MACGFGYAPTPRHHKLSDQKCCSRRLNKERSQFFYWANPRDVKEQTRGLAHCSSEPISDAEDRKKVVLVFTHTENKQEKQINHHLSSPALRACEIEQNELAYNEQP